MGKMKNRLKHDLKVFIIFSMITFFLLSSIGMGWVSLPISIASGITYAIACHGIDKLEEITRK